MNLYKDHQEETFSEQYGDYLENLCDACQDLPESLLINKKDEVLLLAAISIFFFLKYLSIFIFIFSFIPC